MKKLLSVALALAIALGVAAQQPAKKQFRIYGLAFYNLENLFDTINNNGKYDIEFSPRGQRQWNSDKYWSKINNLAYTIANMTSKTTPNGPAVIGVSEIENRSVLEDLVKARDVRGRMYQIIHHDSPDRRGVDVGLLYDPRQFKPVNVTNHRLTIEGYPTFRTRDQLCVTGQLGPDTINIIVNHWPSRLGGQEQSSYLREAAAALSKQIADSIWRIHPDQGVVVMGDLNDDPFDKSAAKVLGGKKEAKDAAAHGFYNPWWKLIDKGIGTLAYKGAWNLFDQIIISGNLADKTRPGHLKYWKCRVDNFDFLITREGQRQGSPHRTFSAGVWLNGYSDHFPTEIFLMLEK